MDFKQFKKILLEIKKKRKINSKSCLNIKDKSYVDYPKENLKNYYNEIYKYLMNNSELPKRLEYSKDKNRKTMEKKGKIP